MVNSQGTTMRLLRLPTVVIWLSLSGAANAVNQQHTSAETYLPKPPVEDYKNACPDYAEYSAFPQ